MKAYKVYYDKDAKKFKCDDKASDVGKYTQDGTTSWVDTYEHACEHVNIFNSNNLKEIFICKDCGNSYWLTKDEQQWFKDKDMELPKRCCECREARKYAKKDRTV